MNKEGIEGGCTQESRGRGKKKKRRRVKKIRRAFTNFRMLYSNINHLPCKVDSLKSIIEETKPAVVTLVETKLGENQEFTVEGYHPVPMNRNENGGGVLILVKKELENVIVAVAVEKNKEVGEALWITLTNGRNNIRLGVVYAPKKPYHTS